MPATRPAPRRIEGRFISLAPLEEQQLPALFRAIGTPEVFAGGYGGGPKGFRATEAEFVDFAHGYYAWLTGNVYGVWKDGVLVGTSTLGDFDERNEHAHIGWTAYSPETWGTAVNPEAKLLMLGEAFDNGFGRVKLQADVLNDRSRAAILKLGAQFEGVVRRAVPRADGSWRDTAVYSILIDEWPSVRAGLEARLRRFESA
ncbi:MAG: GNAT family N-acetyltransferase [Actinobacteria bacterium]|nr:GNAT family N-acetyltransferase [Actinomycetota bacterium]